MSSSDYNPSSNQCTKSDVLEANEFRGTTVRFQPATKNGPDFQSWFRGEFTHKQPHRAHLFSANGIRKHVLAGFVPQRPVIDQKTTITAFGSCFAANISNYLSKRNYAVSGGYDKDSAAYVIRCGEGMVNSFVIRQQFEWAWENKTFEGELWHGYDREAYGYDEEIRLATKEIFDKTDVFILTFGLSEVWYDEPTGNVFWRTIPKNVYDPARHKFRVSTVQENQQNIQAIRDLIRKHRPDAKVIMTLSPVPLIATFRDQPCIASNAVSKAVLRLALDGFFNDNPDDTDAYYWPSYELVKDVFDGSMLTDMRHPHPQVIDFIMKLFEAVWCDGPAQDLSAPLAMAYAATGKLDSRIGRICQKRNLDRLNMLIERGGFSEDAKVDKAISRLLSGIAYSWVDGAA